MREYLVAIALILACPSGDKAQRQTKFTKYGYGVTTCETWLTTPPPSDAGMLQWTLGYLTATGYYTATMWNTLLKSSPEIARAASKYCGQHPASQLCQSDGIKDTDSNAVAAWLNQYCKQHPLDDLETASRGLIDALGAK